MAQIVLLVPLGEGPVDPGFGGGRPGYGGGYPSHGLPGSGGHPSQPIYHPGHPDHGLPSQPGHPSQGLPIWAPGHPDAGLPVPPGIDAPAVPPDLAGQLIVLWRLPNAVEWHGKAMDPSLSAGYPLPPAPEPKY